MAATATYADGGIIPSTTKTSTPATGRNSTKRKRAASPSTARSAPSARRSASQQFPTQTTQDFDTDANPSGFDLTALQTNQSAQPQTQDTAAAALNYTMPVDTSGSGFNLQPDSDFIQNNGTPATPSNHLADSDSQSPLEASASNPLISNKPAVGSTEWHKVRKDNHKEVERRRRETINEGINELAKIVPGCEKNKGSILQRAVQYIQKLQDDAQANIDKWTFEKLVTEQAINDLSGKLERSQREKEAWRAAADEAGVDVDSVERRVKSEGKDG